MGSHPLTFGMTVGILGREYQKRFSVAVRKIAISIPEDVLRQVDHLAKKSKKTRSALISNVLKEVSRASSRNDIIDRINRLFEDPKIRAEQSKTSRSFNVAVADESEW
jgi:hypothetical protein